MNHKRIGLGAALGAGVLAATALALAPAAAAVTPGSATAEYNCGFYGGGEATLTATQSGTTATIKLTSSEITTPIDVDPDTVDATLTLAKTGGGTTTFTGKKNPAMVAWGGVTVGPLTGTVAPGDRLNAYPGSMTMVIFGVSVTCNSTGLQSPGPFVFS
ncbi:hypothetical protein ACIQNU_02745 [Streptomyces sp. NPDC091292]|uniref:hypothetical protein n=1 Tax=Streptomyces sp. NPDC091292 TaxID=3365991 RepID=UPI0038279992